MRILPFVFATVFTGGVCAADLHVTVENIASDDGFVYLALYDSEGAYDDQKGFLDSAQIPAAKGSIETVFQGLAPGQYAVTVFHDLNANEEIDTGWFGKPEEPYGFSREATGNFGPPSFSKASIKIDDEDVRDTITLQD